MQPMYAQGVDEICYLNAVRKMLFTGILFCGLRNMIIVFLKWFDRDNIETFGTLSLAYDINN